MGFNGDLIDIPSGNLLHNYGKIHHVFREFCHKKMVMFHSYVTNYQRVVSNWCRLFCFDSFRMFQIFCGWWLFLMLLIIFRQCCNSETKLGTTKTWVPVSSIDQNSWCSREKIRLLGTHCIPSESPLHQFPALGPGLRKRESYLINQVWERPSPTHTSPKKSRRSTPIPKLNSDLLPFWTLASLSMCCNNQSTTLNIWPPENGLIYAYACFFLNVVCEFFFVSSFNAKPCAGSLLSAASCSCFSWVRGPMDATWCNYLPSAEVSWLRGLSALPKSHFFFASQIELGMAYTLYFFFWTTDLCWSIPSLGLLEP